MEDKKKGTSSYSIYPSLPPKIEYELRKLPLQDEIREARLFMSQYTTVAKENMNSISKQAKNGYTVLKGEIGKYGLTKDSTAVQAGSVGGAMLLGYAVGRRKSAFRKFVYPLMGGALVGGAFYLSDAENRTHAYKRIQELVKRVKRVWPSK